MGRVGRHITVMYGDPYPQNGLDWHLKKANAYGIRFPLRTRTSLPALPQLHPQRVAEGLKEVDNKAGDDVRDPYEHPKAKPKDLPKRQRLTWGSLLKTRTLMRRRTMRMNVRKEVI